MADMSEDISPADQACLQGKSLQTQSSVDDDVHCVGSSNALGVAIQDRVAMYSTNRRRIARTNQSDTTAHRTERSLAATQCWQTQCGGNQNWGESIAVSVDK